MSNLNGRVAIVTGGGRGIGRGIAELVAGAGAAVVVTYVTDRASAEQTVAAIRDAGGRAVAVAGDVADERAVGAVFDRATETFGPVDTLVNNAGIYSFQPLADVTTAEFERLYRTNVLGTFLTSRAFAGQVPEAGGSIINITTSGLTANYPGSALYTASKAAVASLTGVLANELGPRRIRVNAVAAGATETDGARALGLFTETSVKETSARTPLRRIGRPDDIGAVVAFLASDDAAWVTGDTVFASGGLR